MPDDEVPYGIQLATHVADYLAVHGDIAHRHPYFCGTGLGHRDGRFLYGYVEDGSLNPEDPSQVIQWFANRDSFIQWLASQSDASLSGEDESDPFLRHNQRIDRDRLEQAARRMR